MVKIMFVCLGNICRSPLAEAVFNEKVRLKGLNGKCYSESCGTAAYHIGEAPDPRSSRVARRHSIPIDHAAQQLKRSDFINYDYIVVMDDSNAKNARRIEPKNSSATVFKLRDFDPLDKGSDVIDPWFGAEDGFEEWYQIIDRSVVEFLHFLIEKHGLT